MHCTEDNLCQLSSTSIGRNTERNYTINWKLFHQQCGIGSTGMRTVQNVTEMLVSLRIRTDQSWQDRYSIDSYRSTVNPCEPLKPTFTSCNPSASQHTKRILSLCVIALCMRLRPEQSKFWWPWSGFRGGGVEAQTLWSGAKNLGMVVMPRDYACDRI